MILCGQGNNRGPMVIFYAFLRNRAQRSSRKKKVKTGQTKEVELLLMKRVSKIFKIIIIHFDFDTF